MDEEASRGPFFSGEGRGSSRTSLQDSTRASAEGDEMMTKTSTGGSKPRRSLEFFLASSPEKWKQDVADDVPSGAEEGASNAEKLNQNVANDAAPSVADDADVNVPPAEETSRCATGAVSVNGEDSTAAASTNNNKSTPSVLANTDESTAAVADEEKHLSTKQTPSSAATNWWSLRVTDFRGHFIDLCCTGRQHGRHVQNNALTAPKLIFPPTPS